MAKKNKSIDLRKNLGKILQGLEERDVTCPVFILTEKGRKKVSKMYENTKQWAELIDMSLEYISDTWDEIGCSDTKQNQNNFAVITAHHTESDIRDMFLSRPGGSVAMMLTDLNEKIELAAGLIQERTVTDIFGRPREEEPDLDPKEKERIESHIRSIKKKVYKKARKKSKKKKS